MQCASLCRAGWEVVMKEWQSAPQSTKEAANVQGWLGSRDTILHAGEGPVQAVQWAGSLVAWANNVGVKVHAAQ